jgi:SPP1 gp7 family putative phage head morphogenesis protein
MSFKSMTFDAQKTIKGKFKPSSNAERDFFRALKKVAQISGHIVDQHLDGASILNEREMQKALEDYAKKITPWAEKQSTKLLEQVQKSNKRAYSNKAKTLGKELSKQLKNTEYIGALAQALQNEQVALIKSIPLEAGLRAQKLAKQAFLQGTRAGPNKQIIEEIKQELGYTTEAAISRAQLIAITETARANAAINQARATAVGSSQYRWHNSGDEAVRDSHKYYKGRRMQGQIFSWDNPPTLDDGTKGHPGTFPRCRCFAEPVFDDE